MHVFMHFFIKKVFQKGKLNHQVAISLYDNK